MWAMIVKEFRQVRRDRRTLAMMIVLPVLLLVVLGYAASFDVKTITVAAAGPQAHAVAGSLRAPFDVTRTASGRGRSWAQNQLRDGKAEMAIVTGATRPLVLIDGSQLFSAKAALAALAQMEQRGASQPGGLAVMTLLPQVLLSGLIFPLTSIAAGVRWIAYFLPLTYFNQISRGVMLRAEPITSLWQPFVFLALLGVIVVTGATLRFRSYLAPATREHGARKPAPAAQGA